MRRLLTMLLALAAVTLPPSLREMEEMVFDGCTGLEKVTVAAGSWAERWCERNDIPTVNR